MNLINTPSFNGYPVLSKQGPLIENILIGNEDVLSRILELHNRVSVMRFELKFPVGYFGSAEVISKLFDSLRFKLKNDLAKKTSSRSRTIHSEIGYVWVKELSSQHGWHYHVALFLNYDVYNCFGSINSENTNMYNRILHSWAGVLNLSAIDARGLVHIAETGVRKLERNIVNKTELHEVLHWLSYLAKLKTKPYGEVPRKRFYGTSQR